MTKPKDYWNYRVVKYHDEDYRIVEVYYENDKPMGWCERRFYGESIKDLLLGLRLMLLAFRKPVLEREVVVDKEQLVETDIILDKEIKEKVMKAYRVLKIKEYFV